MTSSTAPRKVLILSLSGIGNFLMHSPVFTAIKKAKPNWHITVWVAPRGTKILEQHIPEIDSIIEASPQGNINHHWRLINKLRQQKYDIGLMLSPGQGLKGAAYLCAAGISQRMAHTYPLGSWSESKIFLTDAIAEDPNMHDIEQNLSLLKLLSIAVPPVNHYSFTVPASAQQQAKTILGKRNLSSGTRLVGFHAGSAPTFAWKRWPIRSFAAVGQILIKDHNAHVLIFGGPDEKELKEELHQLLGAQATVIDTNLFTTAALMQHCAFVLSNDSGLMHLAAAVGTPTLGLFGPTDEKHTGPRGPQSRVLRAPGTKPVYNTEKNYNLGTSPHPSLLALTPQMVVTELLKTVSNH